MLGTWNPEMGTVHPSINSVGTTDPATGTINPIPADLAGTSDPATGTHDPARSAVYADWGLRTGVTALFPGEEEVRLYRGGTDEFLDALDGPTRIVMESTVHSFVPEDRVRFLDRCEKEGHTLLFIPPRLTGRWIRELGMDKSDFSDPFVFRKMVESGVHLKRPTRRDDAWEARRYEANRKLMLMRNSGQKDDYAKRLIALLPPYKDLDDVKKAALGDGKKYSTVAVAAAGVATEHVNNRAEFERMCGLYAHGYPSQIRADLHHYLYSGGAKRGRLNGEPISVDPKGVKKYGLRKRNDISMSEWRRSLRWLYAQLRDAGSRVPSEGTSVPESS